MQRKKIQHNEEMAGYECNLYPAEEEKVFFWKRLRKLTSEGKSPCAMVRVGEGKVRILHSIIWKPYGKSGELFGFGGCDAYGWSVRNTNHEVTRPIKVYKLDEKCFYSHQIVMTKRFKQDKWEYQNLMGLEFTTYRDSFSYEVGSLDKGAPRGGCYIGNNGHNGDMPEWEYIRRFYGIGPRLERVHFLEEERYNNYVE